MKLLSFSLFSLVMFGGWEIDFENAKKQAEKEHKLVLLNFSGSDWCIPCIQFKKEILQSKEFLDFAENNLVLVNADFPRLNKNQLAKDIQKKNEKLADKYDPEGIFPLTILLNNEGKILKKWEGFPRVDPASFNAQIKEFINVPH